MNTPCDRQTGTTAPIRKYAFVLLSLVLTCAMPGGAQTPASLKITPQPSAAAGVAKVLVEPSTRLFIARAELEAWAKQTVEAAQSGGQLVGSGFALIRPEGPVFSRGIGSADIKTNDRVHPGITYFPVGDIGKLLIAQMLVDLETQNRLTLDNAANNYMTRLSLSSDHNHLSIRDLFSGQTGLTSSLRGSHLYKDKSDRADLGHIKALLKISSSAPPVNSGPPAAAAALPPALASALASVIVEDVGGVPVEQALADRLKIRWNAAPWFNTAEAKDPKYVSQDHRILPTGEVRRSALHPVAPGFEATRGLYLTVNDIAIILASHLKGLDEKDQATQKVTDLVFRKSRIDTVVQGQTRTVDVLELRSTVISNSLHALLIPELEIGFVALVNSSAREPATTRSKTGEEVLPVLGASDLANSFMSHFIALPRTTELEANNGMNEGAGGSSMRKIMQSTFRSPADGAFNRSRPDTPATPLFQRPSVSGLTALFLTFAVLQFALLASARWQATTPGQKISRGLGMASVVFMTATLSFPIVLAFLGHSETLVDPLFVMSQWTFPVGALLALLTAGACLIGWKQGFWGDEREGFQKRLCFTVGSLGVLGLAIVTWQLDLVVLIL